MTIGISNPGTAIADDGRFSSDPGRTATRVALLEEYFTAQVLDGTSMICRDLTDCRRSATTDRFGRLRPEVAFAAGQLSHVGSHYDLVEDDKPLRILVVAMETGRPDENVAMPLRRAQLSVSAALPMSARNPHMQGVMNALRVAVGRVPGTDRAGELLDLAGRDDPVHLFDAYAMTNLRLCSAFRAGSTDSRGTRVMSSNCLRHLSATVRILEPTLCIVQGVEVARQVTTLLTAAQEITPNLHQGLLAGTPTLLATFTHPTARGHQRWGGLAAVPYLHDSVVPTLAAARQLSGAPPGPTPTDAARADTSGTHKPPAAPPMKRSPQPNQPPTPGTSAGRPASAALVTNARTTTREVAAHARSLVAEEIRRCGGSVGDHRVGQRIELRIHTRTGRVLDLRVLSRRAGDWQTSIRDGDLTTTIDDRYWVLVDLAQRSPEFYVVPEAWMVDDIRREHDEYLARHGGHRARTPDSLHHRIQTSRVRRWRERWDLIT